MFLMNFVIGGIFSFASTVNTSVTTLDDYAQVRKVLGGSEIVFTSECGTYVETVTYKIFDASGVNLISAGQCSSLIAMSPLDATADDALMPFAKCSKGIFYFQLSQQKGVAKTLDGTVLFEVDMPNSNVSECVIYVDETLNHFHALYQSPQNDEQTIMVSWDLPANLGGVNEINADKSVNSKDISIHTGESLKFDADIISLVVVNLEGKTVLAGNSNELPSSSLQTGIYLYVAKSHDSKQIGKLVVY